jgi:hypothetical protein
MNILWLLIAHCSLLIALYGAPSKFTARYHFLSGLALLRFSLSHRDSEGRLPKFHLHPMHLTYSTPMQSLVSTALYVPKSGRQVPVPGRLLSAEQDMQEIILEGDITR